MKQLSYWASKNVRLARCLIVGCYILANILGNAWAFYLYAEEIAIPPQMLAAVVIATITALLLHPRKGGSKSSLYSFALHKCCDCVLCFATIALITFTTAGTINSISPAHASFRHEQTQPVRHNTLEAGKAVKGVAGKLQRLKKWYRDLDTDVKVLLVVLAVIATVALGFVWFWLCCNIICSGAEALGNVLLIFGWAGLITGCVFLCRRIIRGPRRRASQ